MRKNNTKNTQIYKIILVFFFFEKAALEKRSSYYLGLIFQIFVRHMWRVHILLKLLASFHATFRNILTVEGILQGF